jgi:hypothetical protein
MPRGAGACILASVVQGRTDDFRHRRKLMYTRPIHWILGWTRVATLLGLAFLAA